MNRSGLWCRLRRRRVRREIQFLNNCAPSPTLRNTRHWRIPPIPQNAIRKFLNVSVVVLQSVVVTFVLPQCDSRCRQAHPATAGILVDELRIISTTTSKRPSAPSSWPRRDLLLRVPAESSAERALAISPNTVCPRCAYPYGLNQIRNQVGSPAAQCRLRPRRLNGFVLGHQRSSLQRIARRHQAEHSQDHKNYDDYDQRLTHNLLVLQITYCSAGFG